MENKSEKLRYQKIVSENGKEVIWIEFLSWKEMLNILNKYLKNNEYKELENYDLKILDLILKKDKQIKKILDLYKVKFANINLFPDTILNKKRDVKYRIKKIKEELINNLWIEILETWDPKNSLLNPYVVKDIVKFVKEQWVKLFIDDIEKFALAKTRKCHYNVLERVIPYLDRINKNVDSFWIKISVEYTKYLVKNKDELLNLIWYLDEKIWKNKKIYLIFEWIETYNEFYVIYSILNFIKRTKKELWQNFNIIIWLQWFYFNK